MAEKHYPHCVTIITDAAEWVLRFKLRGDATRVLDMIDQAIRDKAGDHRGGLFLTDDAGTHLTLRTANLDSAILESDDG